MFGNVAAVLLRVCIRNPDFCFLEALRTTLSLQIQRENKQIIGCIAVDTYRLKEISEEHDYTTCGCSRNHVQLIDDLFLLL